MARTDAARKWLIALGVLSAGSMPPAEAKAKIDAYSPMLAEEFSDWCFTPSSLAFCAKQFKFFPSFGELAAKLTEWRKDNTPPGAYDRPRLEGRAGVLTEEDQDRLDRDWWEARITAIAALEHPTEAWRAAVGMRATLTRPGAHPRQWAVDRLTGIIRNTAMAGADTDMGAVRMPQETKPVPVHAKDYAKAAA